jgi:hypothetical protein
MNDDDLKRIDEECRDALANPRPPDDFLEEPEVEEISFLENGKLVTVRRQNPRYKAP